MSKSYLGHLDTRNTKYQGFVQKNSRQGIGILLDQYLVFVLANWKADQPQGPSVIIYPKRQIFYGNIVNEKPQGICCYIPNNQYCFYGNYDQNGKPKVLAIKFNNQKMVFKAQIVEYNEQILNQFNGKRQVVKSQKLQIKQLIECQSKSQADQAVEHIIGKIPQGMNSYQEFVKVNFQRKSDSLLTISENKNENFIGFKNCQTLGTKIQKNKVKSVGLYSKNSQKLQMGRKFYDKNEQIVMEEGVFNQDYNQVYKYSSKTNRPVEVVKVIQQYFKKSTTFQNKYVKLSFIDQIYRYLNQNLSKQIDSETTQHFGQQILQQNKPKQSYESNKIYTMDEIKKQIYKKVAKKNNKVNQFYNEQMSYTKKALYSPAKRLQAQIQRSRSRSYQHSLQKSRRFARSPSQTLKNHKYQIDSPLRRSSKSNHKFKYLNESQSQLNNKNTQNRFQNDYKSKRIYSQKQQNLFPLKMAVNPNVINHFTLDPLSQKQTTQPKLYYQNQIIKSQHRRMNDLLLRQEELYQYEVNRLKQLQECQAMRKEKQLIDKHYYKQLNDRKKFSPQQIQEFQIPRNYTERSQRKKQVNYVLKNHNQYMQNVNINLGRRPIFNQGVSRNYRIQQNSKSRSRSPIFTKRTSEEITVNKIQKANQQNIERKVNKQPIKTKRRYKYVQ